MGKEVSAIAAVLGGVLMTITAAYGQDLRMQYDGFKSGLPTRSALVEAFQGNQNLYVMALQDAMIARGEYSGPVNGLMTTPTISAVNNLCRSEAIDCARGPLHFSTVNRLSGRIASALRESVAAGDPSILPVGWALIPADGISAEAVRKGGGIEVTLSGRVAEAGVSRLFTGPTLALEGGDRVERSVSANITAGTPDALRGIVVRMQSVKGTDENADVSAEAADVMATDDPVLVKAAVAGEGSAMVRPVVLIRHKPDTEVNMTIQVDVDPLG